MGTKKASNGSNFGWLIRQKSINQKSGRYTFRRRFLTSCRFVSPCSPECYLQSETKVEPDLRLNSSLIASSISPYTINQSQNEIKDSTNSDDLSGNMRFKLSISDWYISILFSSHSIGSLNM